MGQDHEWVVAAAQRFERPLLAYVRRLLGDAGASARGPDVVQEAFLRLCRQARTDIEPRLAPWLFAVCRRQVVDILRKENRMTALTEADPPTTWVEPSEAAETNDLSRAVLARLAGFPPNQQEAVRLKFLQQFSYREIAEVMNLSESHVGVLIHAAMTKLRQAFAEPIQATGVRS